MKKIAKMLVGVDGSENSLRATEFASELAKCLGAEVTLLFVVGPADYPMLGAKEVWADTGAKIGAAELKKASEHLSSKGVPFRTDIDFGHPAVKILEHSERADLVVLGSRGKGAVKGMFTGSVSLRVSQQSKVPVVIVP
ncbi:MAG: universal stress protein [Methanomassiliicoccales archaeon]|nr:MAG: universal stress protein [Methanomassiliicoccales archaeon]